VSDASINDAESLAAFQEVASLEGILPALESAHAFAHAAKIAPTMKKDQILVINCSGRGDKDCQEVARLIERK
jgi:tryptophan synthase beta chain